jgi:hypothetical protein
VWRVGNGLKIRIWKDIWLLIQTTGRVSSPPSLLNGEAMVSELIDIETKWWNTQLLGTLFTAEKAKVIQSIPKVALIKRTT